MDEKTAALIACAKAYHDRGVDLQYDQFSMDRMVQITPRRRIFFPPESATPQHTLYLDCSGFIHAAYYNTFGKELPAKLTWNIIDYVKPRLLYCTEPFEKSPEEKAELEREIRAMLRPGDVVTYELHGGNGHTVMILDETRYIHCSQRGQVGSYDYTARKNMHNSTGFLYIDELETLFRPLEDGTERNFLFSERVKRFSVCRPLEEMGDPTPDAMARLRGCAGLRCGVETNFPGRRQARAGETVEYRLTVCNLTEDVRQAEVRVSPRAGTELLSGGDGQLSLAPGQEAERIFCVRPQKTDGIFLEPPEIRVNGMWVFAPRVLLRASRREIDGAKLAEDTRRGLEKGLSSPEAIELAYRGQGIFPGERLTEFVLRDFFPFEAVPASILYRREQRPETDLAVYGAFGGRGVITPEMGAEADVRVTQLRRSDLEPGDVICCGDDAFGQKTCACLYDGRGLIGQPEAGAPWKRMEGDEMDAFIDSLFGRFVFLLIRPKQLPET